MRRIDLICKLAGPLFIALIDGASTRIAIFVTLAINTVSIPIEYIAIAQVGSHRFLAYKDHPLTLLTRYRSTSWSPVSAIPRNPQSTRPPPCRFLKHNPVHLVQQPSICLAGFIHSYEFSPSTTNTLHSFPPSPSPSYISPSFPSAGR